MSRYSQHKRNIERDDPSNIPWDLGDQIPTGAGLPIVQRTKEPISSLATFGAGTPEDPCILYRCPVLFAGKELDQFHDFARWICQELGFTHIWIRAHVHTWKTRRDDITGRKTGDMQYGEDSHITVYLGFREDWINVHGDIYVKVLRTANGKTYMPTGLMHVEEMKLQDGQLPRNPRLYVWTSDMTKAPSAGLTRAMTSSNWRAK
ncbi:hypothetical protein F4860DRAFT_515291 [Xylaria cubensis]|nr:hypothetical protein F4860DRAFT_515291 [Xylaria cubensis]